MTLLAAGKHVFCEKPLAVNHDDAFVMTAAAERAGLINMVNLTYRNSRALQAARAMIAAGEIGDIRHVEASYLQSWLTAAHWGDWRTDERWLWRLSSAHGSGGVLGDVGIHIVDFMTYGVGLDIAEVSARMKVFDKAPEGRIGAYLMDVNDSVVMNVGFSNGALGVVHMSRFATGHANDLSLSIHGVKGAVRIWSTANDSTLEVCLGDDIQSQTWRRIACPPVPGNAARFVAALRSGVNGSPDFRRAAEVQRILDLCIASDAQGRRLAID
jgi:predicted dehydrogenase